MSLNGEKAIATTQAMPAHRSLGITDDNLLALYEQMVLARAMDERLIALNRQGKVPLVASCQGSEAASMGMVLAAQMDGDCFFFPYYRDMPLKLMLGVTPLETMIGHIGKDGNTFNGGRQFLLQGASPNHPIVHLSNVVGSNMSQAVGYAMGCKHLGEDTVVFVCFGDGGSSQGECHEAMNFAGIHKLPVVFCCYNNRLAISVPQEKQMAIENLADRASGYGFPGVVVDGTDIFDVIGAVRESINRARRPDGGPTFLEFKVERLKPHTSDDDDTRYRTPEDMELSRQRDPIHRLNAYLTDLGLLTPDRDEQARNEARAEVNRVTDVADRAPWPDASTLHDHLYAP